MVHALCNIFGRQFEAFLDENEVLPANGGPCNGRIGNKYAVIIDIDVIHAIPLSLMVLLVCKTTFTVRWVDYQYLVQYLLFHIEQNYMLRQVSPLYSSFGWTNDGTHLNK